MIDQYPHCDQSVLHAPGKDGAPGECEFCDRHPDWQELRAGWGIAYTGHTPEPLYEGGPMQVPCPSDARRGTGEAHTWGGNRPTRIDVPQEETAPSRIMYGDLTRPTGFLTRRTVSPDPALTRRTPPANP